MLVYPARMLKNLESTHGLVYSGQLLLELAGAGMSREDAYQMVQQHAMDAWTNDRKFRELVEADPEIAKLLSGEKLAQVFHYDRQLRNVDAIFERVLAEDADL
jgi:adenylosuccinate lyase